ncbi:Kinesin-like protein KIN [Seminavis robusta]|uniref:Kinesin-like protein KIN n=1 Tax=Seminavis robusta TaxID=568900 RepID=A0A9N8HKM8_9STRA|nr:Kinesin-like protein KIN [Seminavis robusta]|eukprot:Sro957_g224530.1 Kinesin-like protein KIN (294) ;mRNA; r:12904-14044
MPPPSNLKPVQQQLFAENGAPRPSAEKKTHIEVCARIRPLQITMQSSSSYFNDHHASPRKPPVPSTRRAGGIPTPKASAKGNKTPQKSPAPIAEEDLFYAWDVIGKDTASQSPRTDIVQGRTHQYTIDKVYGPTCSTKEVYAQSVKPLVMSAMEGYHSAVLATVKPPFLDREYLIRVSYLEVYKEQIRDLLADGASQIRLFDHREQGLIIKGLREEVVTCPKQIFEILAKGEKRRKIGATNMNQHSSRSHVMVRLWIESRAVGNNRRGGGAGGSLGGNNNNKQQIKTAVRVSS